MNQIIKNEPDMIIASAVCRFMGRPFNTQGRAERERRLEEAKWAIKALGEAGYIIVAKSSFYRPDLDDGRACDVNG